MTQILLGPVLTDATTQKIKDKASGKTYYRKQILPEGKYNYKGTELDLGPGTLQEIVQSYKDKAFDEVPFQFGGAQSEHNNDPFRRGGTLVNMEHTPGKGVYGYFDFSSSKEASEYVEKYPRFGVSPRIVIDHKRADGKTFATAIQHVCGTVVPRINGMSPWEKVELSDDGYGDAETIDLSAETIEGEPFNKGGNVGSTILKTTVKEDSVTNQLTDAELVSLRSWIADQQAIAEATKAQQDAQEKTTEVVRAELPEEVRLSIEATNKTVSALKADNAKNSWKAIRTELVNAGVPPVQLDLAAPIMSLPDDEVKVFDLSDGEGGTVKVSQKTQMLGMLEALKGTVPVGEIELGHSVSGKEPSEDADKYEDIDAFLSEHGI